jgi:hypothetical protein
MPFIVVICFLETDQQKKSINMRLYLLQVFKSVILDSIFT